MHSHDTGNRLRCGVVARLWPQAVRAASRSACQVAGPCLGNALSLAHAEFTFAWAQRPEARCHGLRRDAAATPRGCVPPAAGRACRVSRREPSGCSCLENALSLAHAAFKLLRNEEWSARRACLSSTRFLVGRLTAANSLRHHGLGPRFRTDRLGRSSRCRPRLPEISRIRVGCSNDFEQRRTGSVWPSLVGQVLIHCPGHSVRCSAGLLERGHGCW